MVGEILLACIILIFCTVCSVFDIKEKSVPLWLLCSGIVIAAVQRFIFSREVFIFYLLTALGAAVFYFLIYLITRKKLGVADIIFGLFQGLVLSPKALFVCVIIECASAAIWMLIRRKDRLAFIPFMSLGTIISFFIF